MDKPAAKKLRVTFADPAQKPTPVLPENNNKLTRLLYSTTIEMPSENKITSNLLKYL